MLVHASIQLMNVFKLDPGVRRGDDNICSSIDPSYRRKPVPSRRH